MLSCKHLKDDDGSHYDLENLSRKMSGLCATMDSEIGAAQFAELIVERQARKKASTTDPQNISIHEEPLPECKSTSKTNPEIMKESIKTCAKRTNFESDFSGLASVNVDQSDDISNSSFLVEESFSRDGFITPQIGTSINRDRHKRKSTVSDMANNDTLTRRRSNAENALAAKLASADIPLRDLQDSKEEYILKTLFIVRVGILLHQSFCISIFTEALVDGLAATLGIRGFRIHIKLDSLTFFIYNGQVVYHTNVSWDYDTGNMCHVSCLAKGVMERKININTAMRGLDKIEGNLVHGKMEMLFREYPGRAVILPVMASSYALVFFEGIGVEAAWALLTGFFASLFAMMGASFATTTRIVDFCASFTAGFIAQLATLTSDNLCMSATVIGTLYWFYYGTAFTLGFYEVIAGHAQIGVVRLAAAMLKSFGLAFGAAVGVWAAYFIAPSDSVFLECPSDGVLIYYGVFIFPVCALACMCQFRLHLKSIPVCMISSLVAFWIDYLITTIWKQPDFLSKFVAAFVSTLVCFLCLKISHLFGLSTGFESFDKKSNDGEKGYDMCSSQMKASNNSSEIDQKEILKPLQRQRSDVWAANLPAIYLLVPGSGIFRQAFMRTVLNWQNVYKDEEIMDTIGSLFSTFMVVGIGIAIGIEFAFLLINILEDIWFAFIKVFPSKESEGR